MKREKAIGELRIRNVNAAAVARITQIAKQSGFKSRNAYLKHYIETLAVIPELRNVENRYAALTENMMSILDAQTTLIKEIKINMQELKKNMEQLEEKLNEQKE